MPDHVIGQAEDLVSCPLGHFGEAFRFGLILERVAGEIDSWICVVSTNICDEVKLMRSETDRIDVRRP